MTGHQDAFQRPLPFRRIENFLGEALVDRLLAYADARQADFVPTRVVKNTLVPEIRTSLMLRDLGELRPEVEERFRAVMTATVQELRLSAISLARLELELVAHGDGAFYKTHIDTATDRAGGSTHRALSGVYYFHRAPKGFTGGDLRLYGILPDADGKQRFVDIPPDNDSLLLFPAWAPHEVRPIACPSRDFRDSRFAINCWFRHQPAS